MAARDVPPDGGKRTEWITFRATPALRDALDRLARVEERRRGDVVRRLVLRALSQKP